MDKHQRFEEPGTVTRNPDLLRALLEHAIDGIITIDEQGTIQSFNQAAERLFGYPAREAIGRNVSLLMPEPDRSRHDGYLQHYHQTGEARIIGIGREVVGRHRDGSAIDIRLAVAEFTAAGQRYFVGFTQDIRDRKRAEREARERLAELAHLNRLSSMSELTAGLAHEIKQPLTAIRVTSETCLTLLEREQPDIAQIAHTLKQVNRQVHRASAVIEELRTFLRKGTANDLTRQNLDTLIRGVLTLLTHEIQAANIDVEVDLNPYPCKCLVNRVQIEQVVFNLVKNAIEAIQDQPGRRTLSLVSRWFPDKNHCAVHVQDNGPGIAECDMQRLFHPFFTTKPQGLGQGLTICRSIIESHGGILDVNNRPEGGADFHFTLPLRSGGERPL